MSSSSTSSASSGGWPLKFKTLEEPPLIGKFDEKVKFSESQLPVRMYMKNEEILEEEEDLTVVKDSEYWKRKKQRRRGFRPKSMIILEDSTPRRVNGPPTGLQYEGILSNLNMSDGDQNNGPLARAKPAMKSVSEAPFKYVLLEILTTPQSTTEVNVIPVGDWYSFKKPSVTGQKMLDEVDEDFEHKLEEDKKKLARYRRISEVLDSNTHRPSSSSDAGAPEDMSLPAVFGRAVNRAIKKGSIGKGVVRKHLDDAGVDVDAVREFSDYVGGDYSKVHADDEEEFVGAEQVELEDREAMLVSRAIRGVVDTLGADKDDYFEDNEDTDEEPDEFSGENDQIGAKDPTAGMLDDDLDRSAREIGRLAAAAAAGRESDATLSSVDTLVAAQMATVSADITQRAAVKTVASSSSRTDDEPDAKRARKSGAKPTGKPETGVSESEVELSEDAVRSYIGSMGGRVPVEALREFFKPVMRRYSKALNDSKAGQKKLLDIVMKVTMTEDDAVLGKVLKIKA